MFGLFFKWNFFDLVIQTNDKDLSLFLSFSLCMFNLDAWSFTVDSFVKLDIPLTAIGIGRFTFQTRSLLIWWLMSCNLKGPLKRWTSHCACVFTVCVFYCIQASLVFLLKIIFPFKLTWTQLKRSFPALIAVELYSPAFTICNVF